MAVEPERLPAGGEGRAKDWFALDDVSGLPIERNVVDVEMGVGMVAEIRAGVEPEVQDLTESFDAELGLTACVDEADDGDALVAERASGGGRSSRGRRERTGTAVATHRQVVDRDCDFPAGRHRRGVQDEACQENAETPHAWKG